MFRLFTAALVWFTGGWALLLLGNYVNQSFSGVSSEYVAATEAFAEAVDQVVELSQTDVEAYRSGLRRTNVHFFKNHYSVSGEFDLTPELEALGVQELELRCTFAAEPILAKLRGQIELDGSSHRMRDLELPISQVSAVCEPMSVQRYPDYQRAAH